MSYTQNCSRIEREERRERTHKIMWFTLINATSMGGKNRKLFYYGCSIQVEAYPLSRKYRASLPYIERGQNRKNNRIIFHMSHSPTIHHLELTSI